MASVFSRRVIAYILDFFVVSAFMWILSYLCYFVMNPYETFAVYQYFPIILPILILVYFIFLEKTKGATVGKALMYIEVRSRNGARINWAQAIVRNLSKIYWVPIVFDWGIGKLLGMDNNRILGNITKTVVIDEFR
ncbi:MAG: RDD family protein [Methanobrevibacter sp.]|uniref:RDD family protein n=1 Tax=uncultured Methanobrevibacter sp. TaxID=253161 RepID=UPI0025F5D97D|nr:RDD family protein [uncultured Methanobrevibacter sp.]MEE1129410.1 RDD family protein [Methanobrevibacter sp.]